MVARARWIIIGILIGLLSGCMTVEEQRLTDLIAEVRYGGLPGVSDRCSVFAGSMRDKLNAEGIDNSMAVVSTQGTDDWDHIMVKVGDYYIDNNSWFPYKRGDGLFNDLHFYKFKGED